MQEIKNSHLEHYCLLLFQSKHMPSLHTPGWRFPHETCHGRDSSMTGSWLSPDTLVVSVSVSLKVSFFCSGKLMKCLSTSNFTFPVRRVSAQVTSAHPQKLIITTGPSASLGRKGETLKRSKLTKYSGDQGHGSPLCEKGNQGSQAKA